jgi:acyl carrier protein
MVTEQQVRDVIASVRENYDTNMLANDVDFGEAGLDSLDHAAMLLALQEATGIEFPEDASELNTIDRVLQYMRDQEAKKAIDAD